MDLELHLTVVKIWLTKYDKSKKPARKLKIYAG